MLQNLSSLGGISLGIIQVQKNVRRALSAWYLQHLHIILNTGQAKKEKKKAGILKMLQGSYILAALKKVYVFLYVILIV